MTDEDADKLKFIINRNFFRTTPIVEELKKLFIEHEKRTRQIIKEELAMWQRNTSSEDKDFAPKIVEASEGFVPLKRLSGNTRGAKSRDDEPNIT